MTKYQADELLNLAIMEKIPYIIVEGIDDIRIYEEIASSINIQCEIYSVEMLEGLSGGNDGVIDAMGIAESLVMPDGKSVDQFMMGVIDRDARYYRNEMPTLRSIFSLKTYSIESHFVSKFTINLSINKLTRKSLRDEIDINSIYANLEKNISDLYYFSLDALKNAVDPSYKSIVAFSTKPGRRKDAHTVTQLLSRKDALDAFANTLSLTSDIESLRKFVKGKWLLTAYAEELFKEIGQLVAKCKSLEIKQCCMCGLDNSSPCLYQLKGGLNKNSLYSILKEFVSVPDLDYIRDAFKNLSATAST
jgi:hypothetical protein